MIMMIMIDMMMLCRVDDGQILGHDVELVELLFRRMRSSVVSKIMLNQKIVNRRTSSCGE